MLNIHHSASVDVRISFPALDRFVDYLRSEQQKQIDALMDQVRTLTSGLKESGEGLGKAVTDEQK